MLQQIETPHQIQLFASAKTSLRAIRNYLAGQVLGFTRDEALLEEVVKCVFCRVALERKGEASRLVNVGNELLVSQYQQTFDEIKQKFPTLFHADEKIQLEAIHLAYLDRELAQIDILSNTQDLIGDIYETFIGTALRGQEGQFFTPKVAVRTLIDLTNPQADDLICDPACGSGSFLIEAARHFADLGGISSDQLHGVDKDRYLVRLAQLHLALQYDILFPIHCADSLVWGGNGFETSSTKKLLGQFSLVLANPPFGSKIVALSGKARSNFELAYKWRISKKTGRYEKQNDFANNPPPQVLFVERCISLLREGGRLGIVLPESVLSNPNHRHVVQYILDHTTPIAIIGMPETLFKTSGKGGTHTKVCLMVLEKRRAAHDHQIFMAEAKWCGHDSRAKGIAKDDLPAIIDKFRDFQAGQALIPDRFGYAVPLKNIKNNILAPRFHDPSAANLISNLSGTHTLYKISDLVADGILSLSTGDEVGKLAYGSGTIPFVRTSDISGWEIKVDPKHLVDRETYLKFARKQDVREGDILMVRDGTYLIGTCAFVAQDDTEIVYQSHIYKIRVNPNNLFDNYLLLAVLSSQPVVAQIKSMSFTQDIIDTLGDRIYDIILPIPNSLERRKEISNMVKKVIEDRVEARELARKARLAVTDP